MDARYYNGEPDDWPSVGGGGFTYAEYRRLKGDCPDCGVVKGKPCEATCGCPDCRKTELDARDHPKDAA